MQRLSFEFLEGFNVFLRLITKIIGSADISLFVSILARSPTQSSTGPTQESKIPPNEGKRTSGLSNDIIWAIIGSCIAVVVIVAIIIIVCCVFRKKQSPGGSKGKHVSTPGVFC